MELYNIPMSISEEGDIKRATIYLNNNLVEALNINTNLNGEVLELIVDKVRVDIEEVSYRPLYTTLYGKVVD